MNIDLKRIIDGPDRTWSTVDEMVEQIKQAILTDLLSKMPEKKDLDNTALFNNNTQAVANSFYNTAIERYEQILKEVLS